MSDFNNDWRARRAKFDPDDDYHTFGDEDEAPDRRRPFILISIAILIIVFGGVVFLAYKQGMNQGAPGEPPILRADNTPDKVAPENPGGTTVPHQDKTIYDRIGGDGSDDENVEHLLPRAEEPMPVKKEAAAESAPAAAPTETAPVTTAPATTAPVTTAPVTTAPVESAPGAPANITPQTGAITTAPVAPIAQGQPVEDVAPVETPATPVATSSGTYFVQLAALRDEATANTTFKKLQAKFPSDLGGLSMNIERADLGAKGIYYRLRAGTMDKAQAQALCSKLSSQGQDCLVKAK